MLSKVIAVAALVFALYKMAGRLLPSDSAQSPHPGQSGQPGQPGQPGQSGSASTEVHKMRRCAGCGLHVPDSAQSSADGDFLCADCRDNQQS